MPDQEHKVLSGGVTLDDAYRAATWRQHSCNATYPQIQPHAFARLRRFA